MDNIMTTEHDNNENTINVHDNETDQATHNDVQLEKQEKNDPEFDSKWYDLIATIMLISIGSFLGVTVRYSFGIPVTIGSTAYADMWPNFAGTLILAFVMAEWIDYTPLFLGIGTGFCGSCTTFSSWMLSASSLVGPISVNMATGPRILEWTEIMIIIASVSLIGWDFGKHLNCIFPKRTNSKLSRTANLFFFAISVIAFVFAVALVTVFTVYRYTPFLFSICWGPFGALLRWQLGALLNSKVKQFPIGTFIANIFASCLLAMAHVIAMSGHAGLADSVPCSVLIGFADGFCGSLSTISTFVKELKGMDRKHAYIYGLTTVIVGQASQIIIIGGVTLSGVTTLNSTYCSV